MKKLLTIGVAAIIILSTTPLARAQVVPIQSEAYLKTQIEILTKILELMRQIQSLQDQIAAMQSEQNKIQGRPYSYPAVPETATASIGEDGIVSPSVKLYAYGRRTVNLFHGEYKSFHDTDGKIEVKTDGRPGWEEYNDDLEIEANVGNPDRNFQPSWECKKTGNWSGGWEPYDHREEVKEPQTGVYGVRCGDSESSVWVEVTKTNYSNF